jgi:hypothetical protein
VETLQLLPPLVTAHDVRTFLLEALRAPIFDTRVIREISKSRNDQLARNLMVLQAKRVKVTDSRMYGPFYIILSDTCLKYLTDALNVTNVLATVSLRFMLLGKVHNLHQLLDKSLIPSYG